jgi:hypothetical protein
MLAMCSGVSHAIAALNTCSLMAANWADLHPSPTCDGGADRWIEPQRSAAGLPRVPNGNNLLSVSDRLALGLGTLDLGSSIGGRTLAILRSAVRTHGERLTPGRQRRQGPSDGMCQGGVSPTAWVGALADVYGPPFCSTDPTIFDRLPDCEEGR